MKQVLLRKGVVTVEDVPVPARNPHHVLVEVSKSVISTGTEISSIQQSQQSLLEKAKKKPDALVKVLDSIRVRGLSRTLALVQGELDQFKPLGYSCAGRVIAVGEKVTTLQVGDRVACAGATLANHAEIISVPANLSVKIPQAVSDRDAAFVTLGAIALQGVRRADVRLGETVCVIGLGLLGQLTVQLLASAGCRVIGMDLEAARVKLASKLGLAAGVASFVDLQKRISTLTGGQGADATIITASTDSSDPAQQAFEVTRKKGRVVVVGAVGLELKRSPFYEKEQDFLISCSYGPGRYDASYELEGKDYPFAYVRWTENRNMSAFLELIADQKIRIDSLVEEEVPLEESTRAYESLNKKNGSKPLAIVLSYPEPSTSKAKRPPLALKPPLKRDAAARLQLGLIGVGSFTKATHVPNLLRLEEKVEIAGVCTANSATATSMGKRLKTGVITTDYAELIGSPSIEAVLISTRHNTHAAVAETALKAGKHVYLEKPLALSLEETAQLDRAVRHLSAAPVFMVGFNRRFSPFSKRLQAVLQKRTSPLMAIYRVNAGALPADHWTHGEEGGGRLRGEACHMIDLFRFLVQSPLESVDGHAVHSSQGVSRPDENFSAQFSYEDGSLCQLVYTTLGHDRLPKEYLEVHWEGMSAVIEDFRRLSFYGLKENVMAGHQDKGHVAALETFISSISTGVSFPIPWDQLVETTQAAIQLDQKVWGKLPS